MRRERQRSTARRLYPFGSGPRHTTPPGMNDASYLLRAKSGGWSHHPDSHDADYRLLRFTLVASRDGRPLGGNNAQAVLGAPDTARHRLDQVVVLWLPSGSWVSPRNQFAQAADIAAKILESVNDPLSELTAELTTARGARTEELTRDLFAMTFNATGPDYWR
jgi:hypothetical protein